ncbi:MAG: hypothetical protein LH472_16360 [Pyrinomonadaceae bacterium]|nr:hypothetical protein [Pyrinomonadaceae bacterium]
MPFERLRTSEKNLSGSFVHLVSLGECYKNNLPPRNSKSSEIKIKRKFFDAVGKW